MRSIKIGNDRDFKRKLLWCFFWANRKAIRTEGCAPFLFDKIVTSEATYAPEIGNILKLSNDLLQKPLIHALRDEYSDVQRQAARSLAVLTVLSEEIAKSMIHDYELNLEEQDRASFRKSKKMYEQELEKLQAKSSK